MKRIINLWPRSKGQQWNLPKFHEQIHVPDDIERHGSPKGTHSGPTEQNHISHVKKPASNTQGRRDVINKQIADRVSESYIISMSMEKMESTRLLPKDDHCETTACYLSSNASSCTVNLELDSVMYSKSLSTFKLVPAAISFLKRKYKTRLQNGEMISIPVYSEVYINGNLYRAHLNYRGNGPWFDWVMIRWKRPSDHTSVPKMKHHPHLYYGENTSLHNPNQHLYTPGKILGFFVDFKGKIRAIIETCDWEHKKHSVFTSKWKYAYHKMNGTIQKWIMSINVEYIVRHCLVVPIHLESDDLLTVWPPKLWADEFINFSDNNNI